MKLHSCLDLYNAMPDLWGFVETASNVRSVLEVHEKCVHVHMNILELRFTIATLSERVVRFLPHQIGLICLLAQNLMDQLMAVSKTFRKLALDVKPLDSFKFKMASRSTLTYKLSAFNVAVSFLQTLSSDLMC